MGNVVAVAVLLALAAVLILLVLAVLAVPWRYLPLSQRTSEVTFTALSVLLLTPVPIGVGVGAMYYPVAMLYVSPGILRWHFDWYARSPEAVVPSLVLTAAIAYFVSHK